MGLQPIYQRDGRGARWTLAGTLTLILCLVCGCEQEVQLAIMGGLQDLSTSLVASSMEAFSSLVVLLIDTAFTQFLPEDAQDVPTTVQAITETMARMLA